MYLLCCPIFSPHMIGTVPSEFLIVKLSAEQAPPSDSVVSTGPRMVNTSKSNLNVQMSALITYN